MILLLGLCALAPVLLVARRGRLAALPPDPCRAPETGVVVDTASRTLWLCQAQQAVQSFRVALGSGGLDKRREGDEKTPLGEYTLSEPRPSARFGIFIPVAYPTRAQREQGLTGSDIGIHGPHRSFKWLGSATTWVDWTQGCVAVGTDAEISRIAAWVRQRPDATVVLR